MDKLKDWYAQLAKREQQLVLAASIVLFIGFIFQFVIGPINNAAAKAETDLVKHQKLLVWVTENAAKVKSASASGKTANSGSLSQVINRTARAVGIQIAGTRPQGEALQVQIDTVQFDTLLSWLESLSSKHSVRIVALDINATDTKGLVVVRRLQLAK